LPAGAVRLDLPRFVLALPYLLTTRLTIAFASGWTGLIGFFILPYATLF